MDANAQHGHGGGQEGKPGGPPSIGEVSGKITDASGNPVEYATIALKSVRDSSIAAGGVTDTKGKFNITEIKLGKYILIVDFIGFTRYESEPFGLGRNGVTKDFGKIAMQLSDENELEEVEVRVDKPLITTAIDKKVFNAEQNITAAGGTALDVLQNVPSVEVDQDDNVSLRGNQNVRILIDGRPSNLTTGGLSQIPASSIENIEIITNPSAKYDPDGMSGIINIILKKNKLRGFNGMVSAQVGNGRLNQTASKFSTINKYNVNTSLGYRNQKINVYGNLTVNAKDRYSLGIKTRETSLSDTVYGIDQDSYKDGNRDSYMGKFGFDYYVNKKITINTSATYNTRNRDGIESINYIDLFNEGVTKYRLRNNDNIHGGTSLDLNVGYAQKFSKKDQSLNIQFNHSIGTHDEDGIFKEQVNDASSLFLYDFSQRNVEQKDNAITTLQLDYVHPVNDKLKFETGYKTILRSIDNTFEAYENDVFDTLLDGRFIYDEQIHAVYGIGAYKFNKKWSTQIGLRQELTTYNSTLVDVDTIPNNYNPLFPSAYLNYALDDYSNLNLSFSRRINRPSVRALNPFTDYSDPFLLRSGNAFLQPEFINSFELGFSKYTKKGISINPSLYYKHTTDVITRVVRTDPTLLNRRIVRQENIGVTDTYGAEFIFSGKVQPFWRLTASSNFYWNKTTSELTDVDLNNQAIGGRFSLINNFTVKKNTDIQIMSWYSMPRYFALGRIKYMGSIDLAVKHKIWSGKADISLRVSDIFDMQRFAIILDYDDEASGAHIYDDVVHDWESRNAYIGFTYRFGKLEQSKKGRGRGGNKKGNEGDFNAGDGGGGM